MSCLIEGWRVHDNSVRPRSTLGYRAPAPEVIIGPASPALSGARPALTPRLVQPNVLHELSIRIRSENLAILHR